MNNILNTSSHGNCINTLLLKEEQILRKFTSYKSKYKYIENEMRGLNWYSNKLKNFEKTYDYYHFKDFIRLDIFLLPGKSVCYRSLLRHTSKYIYRVINHYKNIWDDIENPKVHGDLTLSNILFHKNQLRIIDWEHFYEGPSPWGFDLIYLIMSSVILPNKKHSFIDKIDIYHFQLLWFELLKLEIDEELICNPLNYFINFFKKNEHWREIILESPNKMYPLNLSKEEINYYHETLINPLIKN